jgi:hypothetical protein
MKTPYKMLFSTGLWCILPIFASRSVLEMQNWYPVRIGNAHIKSTHRWIANIIVLLVISSDLGDVPWSQHWRKCGHDQESLTGILLIIITVEMTGKNSLMPDSKYWADGRLNRDSGPFLERRNFRIFLNYHWWDLINTNCIACLAYTTSRIAWMDPDRRITWNIGDATFLPHRAFIRDVDLCIAPSPDSRYHATLEPFCRWQVTDMCWKICAIFGCTSGITLHKWVLSITSMMYASYLCLASSSYE